METEIPKNFRDLTKKYAPEARQETAIDNQGEYKSGAEEAPKTPEVKVAKEILDPKVALLAKKKELVENVTQTEQFIKKNKADLRAARKKLGIAEPEIESAPSIVLAKESLAGVNEKLSKLGFQREDVSGMIQKTRGKENIRYTSPEGKEFFAKYVNQQEKGRDNIAGLKKEKEILDLLADSGVTPKLSELKIYPNEKRARLNIEQVSGMSLDKFNDTQGEEFLRENAEGVINSTAKALDKIHQKKILLVDINEGSFLVDKKDDAISTNVVDFELALNLEKQSPAERDAAFDWYSSKDIGLRLAEGIDCKDTETFKKAEITLWARTLAERIIGFSQTLDNVVLSPEKQKQFDEMAEKIKPSLVEKITKRAKRSYEYETKVPKEERYFDLPTEEEFIAKEIKNELPQKINAELLGITLEEKLKANNIKLSKEAIDFMSRALSLELENRPASFDGYL